MADYRLTPAARQDVDDIFEHSVANWGLQTALDYAEGVVAAFKILANSSQHGMRIHLNID